MTIITRTFTFDTSVRAPMASSSNLWHVEVMFHVADDGTFHVNLEKMIDDLHLGDCLPEDAGDLTAILKTPLERVSAHLVKMGYLDPGLVEESRVLTAQTGWTWAPGVVAVIWLSASPLHSGPARPQEPALWLENILESITTV